MRQEAKHQDLPQASMTTTRKRPTPVTDISPWTRTSSREEQREAKRNAVLQAAAQLFNERGFHATSLDDVAEKLNVSKPTLYYYVKNKEEILFECVRQGLAMMQKGIEDTRKAGGQTLDQLTACLNTYARIVTMDFGMCLIRIGEDPLSAPRRKELRKLKAAIDMEFRRLIAKGIDEGVIAPCDPKMAAFVTAGALSWIGRWYRPDGEFTPEQIAEQCNAILFNGILQRTDVAAAKVRPATKTTRRKVA
jgi:AcrR family transcriptional regulator